MTEYERVIEEIAKELYRTKLDATQVWGDLPDYLQEYWRNLAKRLLSLKHPNGNPMVYLGGGDQNVSNRQRGMLVSDWLRSEKQSIRRILKGVD